MFFEIFLFGIEEGVLRRPSVGIPMRIGEFAVIEAPAVDPRPLRRQVDLAPGGLKVIDKAEHHVDRFIGHTVAAGAGNSCPAKSACCVRESPT